MNTEVNAKQYPTKTIETATYQPRITIPKHSRDKKPQIFYFTKGRFGPQGLTSTGAPTDRLRQYPTNKCWWKKNFFCYSDPAITSVDCTVSHHRALNVIIPRFISLLFYDRLVFFLHSDSHRCRRLWSTNSTLRCVKLFS